MDLYYEAWIDALMQKRQAAFDAEMEATLRSAPPADRQSPPSTVQSEL